MDTTIYKLRVTFTEPLLGTQPQKSVATEFVQAKAREKGLDVADEETTLPEMMARGTTAFHKLDGRPILYDYAVRGFLKEAARALGPAVGGIKALPSKIDNWVFVFPRQIELRLPDGAAMEYEERPLRAQTAQGPRVSVVRSERLPAGTWFECEIRVLEDRIPETVLRELLEYGIYRGFGQWRNASFGRFEYTLLTDAK